MMQQCIFGSSEHADRVDTDVLVEALILGVYQCLEEGRVHVFVFHRSTVLVEILTDELAIGTVNQGSLRSLRIQNTRKITR